MHDRTAVFYLLLVFTENLIELQTRDFFNDKFNKQITLMKGTWMISQHLPAWVGHFYHQ